MSQIFSTEKEPNANPAAATDQKAVQVALRLRPVDRSDRPIVSNVSAVHASSGMVFVDFGFIEQQAIDDITRSLRAGSDTVASIEGRLECRIAMSIGDIAQLSRQLQQVLAAIANTSSSMHSDPASAAMAAQATSLQ